MTSSTCVFSLGVTVLLTISGLSAVRAEDFSIDIAGLKPLEMFQECGTCPEMIVLPLGDFLMGGPPGESRNNINWDAGNIRRVTSDDPYIAKHEGPLHRVTIDLPIAMGRNEVTFGEWNACVADGGCNGYAPPMTMLGVRPNEPVFRKELHDGHPVQSVSYNDMQSYLWWLNRKVRANVYRLPTEAEWEYAARAGTQTPFAQGEEVTTDQVNFSGEGTEIMLGEKRPDLETRGHPVPVDELDAANDWGLRHMSGNARERTSSCWTERHPGWPTSSLHLEMALTADTCYRIWKGGSALGPMDFTRLANRTRSSEEHRAQQSGFRVVRNLGIIKEE
ncbi:MAG: formylglycine-generating enzyme family protein [Litoreibacter sp.]